MKSGELSGGVLQTNAGVVSASAFWKARALSAELRTFAVSGGEDFVHPETEQRRGEEMV
jgi:hypothetical protein